MKALAYSGTALIPALMHAVSRHRGTIEHKSRFTPGLHVKVLLESGVEEGALLRWS
jgi:hypothetical protein